MLNINSQIKKGSAMKSLFKAYLLLVSFQIFAGRVEIQVHSESHQWSQRLKRVLIFKYRIPRTLIKLKVTPKCKTTNVYSVVFCIDRNANLEMLENENRDLILSSLSVFKEDV